MVCTHHLKTTPSVRSLHCITGPPVRPTRAHTQHKHEPLEREKRSHTPKRHLPRTCPIFWVLGCWTLRWPLLLGYECRFHCSSECRLPPPRPVHLGQGCPQPLLEEEHEEPQCKRGCEGHGAHRSDRERRWHSCCLGDPQACVGREGKCHQLASPQHCQHLWSAGPGEVSSMGSHPAEVGCPARRHWLSPILCQSCTRTAKTRQTQSPAHEESHKTGGKI